MRLFGSLKELVSAVFRKDTFQQTLEPSQLVTYTADRIVQLPAEDAASTLISRTSTDTLTNKSISGSTNTLTNISLTAGVTGILPAANGGTGINNSSTLTLGANNTTFTTGGTTSVTLPTSGTLATLAGSETLSNKTLDNTTVETIKAANLTIQDGSDTTKQAKFVASNISTGTTRSYTLPDTSDTLLAASNTTSVANKTLDETNVIHALDGSGLLVKNAADHTKIAQFDSSGITTATTRTFTFPDASTTLVGTGTIQALTNKDYQGGTASNTSRITLPGSDTTTLNGLTRKAGTIVYNTTTTSVEYDDGSVLNTLATSTSSLDSALNAQNLTITDSVATNALTINLKTKAGADPSSGDPVKIAFRNTTAATGDYTVVSATAATSITIPSGATLGMQNSVDSYIWLYALNNAGTIELAVITTRIDEGVISSSTTITSGSNTNILYSTTGRSNKAIRLIGRLKCNQTTAGTYTATLTEIALNILDSGDRVGDMSGFSAGTGKIGEIKTSGSTATQVTSMSSNTWTNIASVSLTAGDWDVTGRISFEGTESNNTGIGIAISAFSGNTTTDHLDAINRLLSTTPTNTGFNANSLQVASYRVIITTTTTYFVKALSSSAGASPSMFGFISARRVR